MNLFNWHTSKRFKFVAIVALSVLSFTVYLAFGEDILSPLQPIVPVKKGCIPPCEIDVRENGSISLTGTLIDFQTVSVGITSLSGSNHATETYYLALWQGVEAGKWQDTLKTQLIEKGDLSMILFQDLNISMKKDYTIGLGVWPATDTIPCNNICATLAIPAGTCPPMPLQSRESGICIKARYVRSIILNYWTPSGNSPESCQQWVSVYEGALTPALFPSQTPIKTQFVETDDNTGSMIMENLNLDRMATYTVVYGMGILADSIPDYNAGVAAASFRTD
jgi:hypothetical protein